jgi:hypothetical protein
MTFARWTFRIAGLYGLLVLIPGFFLERQAGLADPPPITHPEFYYGFYGAALVFQLIFLTISRDPARWRPLMLIAVAEKIAFFVPCLALYFTGRMALAGPFIGGMIDGMWMVLFAVSWRLTRPKEA